MTTHSVNYHRQRAAEEELRAVAAADERAAEIHRRLSALHYTRAQVQGQDDEPDPSGPYPDRVIEI